METIKTIKTIKTMRSTKKILIFITTVLIIIVILFPKKKNKLSYDVSEISNDLITIDNYKEDIYNEMINVYRQKNEWKNWPEKNLYNKNNKGTWKIYPFYAFGIWANKNCNECPILSKYLKSINGLKLATLSCLSPGMKIEPHCGWGYHSNHVIRCHYGLLIPNGCYILVGNTKEEMYNGKKVHHKKFEWFCFDDSKWHSAENTSDSDRIILILDMERPKNIRKGISDIKISKELDEIVEYYKKYDIMEYNF